MEIPLSPTRTVVASPTSSWSSGCNSCSTVVEEEEESLITAITTGDLDEVQSLITAGASITERNTWVLYHACLKGFEMTQALLASPRIDFNAPMVELQSEAIVHHLLRTPAECFEDPKFDVVKLLIHNGVKPLQRDQLGDTVLHILAGEISDESTDLVKYLFGDTQTPSTALAPEFVQMECRAHVNLQDRYNNTPLVIAILYNNVHCIKLLLQYGADPRIRGEFGYSAVDFAKKFRLPEAARLLDIKIMEQQEKEQQEQQRSL